MEERRFQPMMFQREGARLRERPDAVNYLREIQCFYTNLEMAPLRANAISLWHALMNQWNRSFWTENFTPAMQLLTVRSGMSKSSVLRARNELIDAGLLRIEETGKRDFTRYHLALFEPNTPHFDTLYKQY